MCHLLKTSQGIRLVQCETATHQPASLLGQMGVLLHALPEFILKNHDKNGSVYDLGGRTVISICRCGLSKNKPFCDASHKGHFEHEAIAFNLPPKN